MSIVEVGIRGRFGSGFGFSFPLLTSPKISVSIVTTMSESVVSAIVSISKSISMAIEVTRFGRSFSQKVGSRFGFSFPLLTSPKTISITSISTIETMSIQEIGVSISFGLGFGNCHSDKNKKDQKLHV